MHNKYRTNLLGDAGEDLLSFCLKQVGCVVSRPEPDIEGIDREAHFREGPLRDVRFRFQAKSRHGAVEVVRHGVAVRSQWVCEWLDSLSTAPVFLVRICPTPAELTFLPLHPWLLEHPGWHVQGHAGVTFSRKDFSMLGVRVRIGSTTAELVEILEREGARVSPAANHRWSFRTSVGVPFYERDLFSEFGRVADMEVPVAARGDAERFYGSDLTTLEELVERIRSVAMGEPVPSGVGPALVNWAARFRAEVSPADQAKDVREFGRFASAMRAVDLGEPPTLPGFRWDEVSRWRPFFTMYPRSVELLEQFFNCSARWQGGAADLLVALQLLTHLGASDNQRIVGRVASLLGRLAPELDFMTTSPANYGVVRQFHQANAVTFGMGQRHYEFVTHHHRGDPDAEYRLNRGYYGVSDRPAMVPHFRRQLERPHARHRDLTPVHEFIVSTLGSD